MSAVSVIIPTFNRAAYLPDSISSVLNQKGRFKIEVIVVDDGSTDNTPEVIAEFGDKIKYRKIEPSGRPAVPRNIGIKMASHELIAFQDSDDEWAEDKLQAQLDSMADPDIGLSYGNAAKMTTDNRRSSKKMIAPELAIDGEIFGPLLATNFISTLTVITRKSILEELGGFNEETSLRAVEDYHLWLRICAKYRVAYIDKILAYYREHDDNISKSSELKALRLLASTYERLGPLQPEQRALVHDRCAGIYAEISQLSGGRPKYLILSAYHRIMRKMHKAKELT